MLLFILIWETPIKRYIVDIEPFERSNTSKHTHWFAGDFNGDGNSERIRCMNGVGAKSMDLVHYDKDGYLTEHYHIRGSEWSYNLRPAVFDVDDDGKSELLFFTVRNDSIFFNVYSLTEFTLEVDHLFFDTFEQKRDEYSYKAEFFKSGDFDGDGNKEVIFQFDAGFGLSPRGVFKIEFPSLKITRSNSEYMVLGPEFLQDINQDEKPEIFCRCAAPANTSTYKKYSDTISYVAILDQDLNFVFEPLAFSGEFSSVQTVPEPSNDTLFYACFFPRSENKIPPGVYVISTKGKILDSKSWPGIHDIENLSLNIQLLNNKPFLSISGVGTFLLTPGLDQMPNHLEPDLNDRKFVNVAFDLDGDGLDEWINVSGEGQVIIFNEKTDDEITFSSPRPIVGNISIYPFYSHGKLVKYLADTGAGFFYFRYQQNPYYYVLYVVYILVLTISSLSVWFILYLQKRNIEQKWLTEKQLSELQFNSIKNQLNPHFLFNALNSVAYMIYEGKSQEAYDFLNINSRMIQRVMNDANEVKRSLKAELQFTEDYIHIQKHRFKERFDYNIKLDPKVNTNFEVPKMCIHTYVENAIKHGFRSIKSGGLLTIEVEPCINGIFISISDNGVGRKAVLVDTNTSKSRNGIRIMNEFYRLFELYHGYKISYRISDLRENSGTLVNLHIQHKIQ